MTLVMALVNLDQIIQISDRRLTDQRGALFDDAENKACVLTARDARVICGFSGLAHAAQFRTNHWLVDALYESAPPDHLIVATIERFTAAATKRFSART
jgi:hypothetical protein